MRTVAERLKMILENLQRIPGIGPSLARDLVALGIRRVSDLRGRSAQRLYDRLCALTGSRQDRCILYVFRCAVYFASEKQHDPERLKWWHWKDAPGLAKRAGKERRRSYSTGRTM